MENKRAYPIEESHRRLTLDDLVLDGLGDGTGLLWAINRYLLHPRGYSLAVVRDTVLTKATGTLGMLGDGSEPWSFTDEIDKRGFAAFEASFPVRPPVDA